MHTANQSRQTQTVQQAVFVLHTYPFKETSLIVELFSYQHGRVITTAKGARRPRSAIRGMMQSFQPLIGTWSGKLELKTLHSLEWGSGLLMLKGEALMCGFYLNELLLRLLPREDPHEKLFEYYSQTLKRLSTSHDFAATLRRFELTLLQELGYAIPLKEDAKNTLIEKNTRYIYEAEHGAIPISQQMHEDRNGVQLSGQTLLNMANDDYEDINTQQQSKQLMRYLLQHYLGDKPLHTRQLLIDLQGI